MSSVSVLSIMCGVSIAGLSEEQSVSCPVDIQYWQQLDVVAHHCKNRK